MLPAWEPGQGVPGVMMASVAVLSKVVASDTYQIVRPLSVPRYEGSTDALPVPIGHRNLAVAYAHEARTTNLYTSASCNDPCTGEGSLHGGDDASPRPPPAKRQNVAPSINLRWENAGDCAPKLDRDRRDVTATATIIAAAAAAASQLLPSSEARPLPWRNSLTENPAPGLLEASQVLGSYAERPLQVNANSGYGAAPIAFWPNRQSILPNTSLAAPPADLPQQGAASPYPPQQQYQLPNSLQYSHQHNAHGGPQGLHPSHPTFTRQQEEPQQQIWPEALQRLSHGQDPQTWPQQEMEFGLEKLPLTSAAESTAGKWSIDLKTQDRLEGRKGHTAGQHLKNSALGGTYDQLEHQQPQSQTKILPQHQRYHLQPPPPQQQQQLMIQPSCKQDDENRHHPQQRSALRSCPILAAAAANTVPLHSTPSPSAASRGGRVSGTGTGFGSGDVDASVELMRLPNSALTPICQAAASHCTSVMANLTRESEVKQQPQLLPQALPRPQAPLLEPQAQPQPQAQLQPESHPQPQPRSQSWLQLQQRNVVPLAHGTQQSQSAQCTNKACGPQGQKHLHPYGGTQQPMSLPADALCVPPPPAAALVWMQRNVGAAVAELMPLQQQHQQPREQQLTQLVSEQRLGNLQHRHLPKWKQSQPPSQLPCEQAQKFPDRQQQQEQQQQQQLPQRPPPYPPPPPLPQHRHHQDPQHRLCEGAMSPSRHVAAPAALPDSFKDKDKLCHNKHAPPPHVPKPLAVSSCGDTSAAGAGLMGCQHRTAATNTSTTNIATTSAIGTIATATFSTIATTSSTTTASASAPSGSSRSPSEIAAPSADQSISHAFPSATATAAPKPLVDATAATTAAYPDAFGLLHAAVRNGALGVDKGVHNCRSAVITADRAAGGGQQSESVAAPAAFSTGSVIAMLDTPAPYVGTGVSGKGNCDDRSAITITKNVAGSVSDSPRGGQESSDGRALVTTVVDDSHIGSAVGGGTGATGGGPGRRLPASLAAVASRSSITAAAPGMATAAAAALVPAAAKGIPAVRAAVCPGVAALPRVGGNGSIPASLPSIAEVRAAMAAAANGSRPKQPVLQFEGIVRYAATAVEVDWLCGELLAARPPVIGLDMEWRPQYVAGSPSNPTALLQICYAVAPRHPGHLPLGAARSVTGWHHGQAPGSTKNNNTATNTNTISSNNNNSGCVGAVPAAAITTTSTVCGGTVCGDPGVPGCDPGRIPGADRDKTATAMAVAAAADAAAADTTQGRHCCCLLLHIIHSGVTPRLRALLEAEEPCKVGVNITGDANKLKRDYGVEMGGLTELDLLANDRVLQHIAHVTINTEYRSRWSLAALVETVLRRQLPKPKNIRCGNWEKRPLEAAQQRYAALDAYAGLAVWAALQRLPLRSKSPHTLQPAVASGASVQYQLVEATAADLAADSGGADGYVIMKSDESSSTEICRSMVVRDDTAAAEDAADMATRPGDSESGGADADAGTAAKDR
ncbi:hypothetical protein Vretimale_16672 [Volvox reticuliferus]|uniref:3'-5' exonuclease n=1 Tax=Volvox reticuliferus TaxID=1737510 RepID=A0A8J4GRQ0_9CHLO|nr:hypothetical protein Vretimale_16672 [Volvox reticuliferus]